MGISFAENEGKKLFKLDTPNTSYIIGVICEEGFLGHVYFGKKRQNTESASAERINQNPPA